MRNVIVMEKQKKNNCILYSVSFWVFFLEYLRKKIKTMVYNTIKECLYEKTI